MRTKDQILLEEAYKTILEFSTISENQSSGEFEKYKKILQDFFSNLKTAEFDLSGLDYSDENGILTLMMPSVRFSSDVNIDNDLDVDSQISRTEKSLYSFLDKNPQLKEIITDINVERSYDDINSDNEFAGTDSDNEWIGVNIYTGDDIHIDKNSLEKFLTIMKFINDFLINLTTFPSFNKIKTENFVHGIQSISEAKKKSVNPYAVCTASVGRKDEEKYKSCKKKVASGAKKTGKKVTTKPVKKK